MGEGGMTVAFEFDKLPIRQVHRWLVSGECVLSGTKPSAKVGGERIKVTAETIGGGSRNAVRH